MIKIGINTLELIQDHIEIIELDDGLDRIGNALERLKYVTEAENGHLNYVNADLDTMNFSVAERRHKVLMDKIIYTYKRYHRMAINKLDKERTHHTTTTSACDEAREILNSNNCKWHYINIYSYLDPSKGYGWVTNDKGLQDRKINHCYTVFRNGNVIDLRQNTNAVLNCPHCHAPQIFTSGGHWENSGIEFKCDGCDKKVISHDWINLSQQLVTNK